MSVDYFRAHVRYEPLDPVNLVFKGLDDCQGLLDAVLRVLDNAQWKQDLQDHEYLLEFDDHFRYESCWRTYGPLWKRYHIRFWHGDTEVLASAHKERLKLWPPGHEVESFDEAKWLVEHVFQSAGWQVWQDSRPMGAPIVDPLASGCASEIVHP